MKKQKRRAAILCLILSAVSFLLATRTDAAGPLELDYAAIEFKQFGDFARHPYFFDNNHPRQELNFHLKNSVLEYGFLNIRLHSMTDEHQFRVAGLNFSAGINLTPWLAVGYDHFSVHLLDTSYPHQGFGVTDALLIRLNIYSSGVKREAFLPW